MLVWLQDKHYLVILQGQRLGEGALLLPGKGVVEIVAGAQRPVQILVVGRRFGKARVVVSHEGREQGVAFGQGCHARQPQFLDEAVLQRLVGALDPPFGRARIGADDIDVEGMQGAAKLGHPVTAKRTRMVDPKDAMLVAIKRHRLAPGLQIGAGRLEIGKGRLALDKLQMHQPARRVVDKHQQSALWPAVFEPPMLAAVDLHQFADAFAPRPRLVNLLALLAIAPQPGFDHPLAQRFTTNRDAVILAQLLSCQGRAKIPIPLADDCQNRAPQCLGLAPVTAATAALRD